MICRSTSRHASPVRYCRCDTLFHAKDSATQQFFSSKNTNDPQNEAFGRRRKKDSPQNRSLDELTSSGKRIRRKSQELRSMVLEKRSESADGQLSADFVVDILDEADRLNEQLVSTISALSQWTARIEKLEENQSKDTNLFQALAERVTQLERRRDVCSSMASSSSMANQHGKSALKQDPESIIYYSFVITEFYMHLCKSSVI